MDYLDLRLRIDTEGNGLVVRLVDSPAGQAEAPFLMPAVEEEVKRTAKDFERLVEEEEPYRDLRPPVAAAKDRQQTIGDQLFRALFPEPIRDRYYQSLGDLRSRPDLGLRIKLQMGLGDPRLTAVHGLPWECLHRAQDGTFLGRERRTSIARYLDLPLPGGRPSLNGPLRVLVVAAQPRELKTLPHLARERRALLDLGRRQNRLEMVPLATPSLEALRNALLSGDFHVLHFLGHGGFEAGEGLLYLEDGAGGAAPVKAPVLADLLRDITSLRLAVLNACQTARLAAPGPFSGVATALLQAGLPAVVAMQFPISDRAARAFGVALYRRLALGDPIDAAVAEGRLAVRRDLPDSAEWATPTLFLRAPDGRLFETRRTAWKPWAAAAALATVVLTAGLLLYQPSHKRPEMDATGKVPSAEDSPQVKKNPPEAGTGCEQVPETYQREAYGNALYALEYRCKRTFTLDEQGFMAGLAEDLANRCNLPTDVTSRLAIEDLSELSKLVGTDRQMGFRAGTMTAQAVKCDEPRAQRLAEDIGYYLERTGSGEGQTSPWVRGCMEFFLGQYTEAQCRCAADAGRAVFPGFHQRNFSPEDFPKLGRVNAVLAWEWLPSRCQILY